MNPHIPLEIGEKRTDSSSTNQRVPTAHTYKQRAPFANQTEFFMFSIPIRSISIAFSIAISISFSAFLGIM